MDASGTQIIAKWVIILSFALLILYFTVTKFGPEIIGLIKGIFEGIL